MTTDLASFAKHNEHVNLLEAERTARCDLLAARDDLEQSLKLESAVFEAYLAAMKASSYASKREDAAFDNWYDASKALDENGRQAP